MSTVILRHHDKLSDPLEIYRFETVCIFSCTCFIIKIIF